MAPGELEVARMAKVGAPGSWLAIGWNASVGAMSCAPTLKLVVAMPVVYDPLAACVACSTTVPTAVTVTLCPETVAGPLSTEYVIVPNDGDDAMTTKAGAPTDESGTGLKVSPGSPGATLKVAVALPDPKFPLAACLAETVTVPLPVSVTVEPEMPALPETIVYTIGAGDKVVALKVKGASPKVWSGTAVSVSAVAAALMVKLVVVVAVAYGVLAACVADSHTLPIPVMVRDVPETVAGPLTTVNVTAPVELEVTPRAMGVLL